jgi:hypothetical protein
MQHRIHLTRTQDARISQRRKSIAVVDSLVVLASKHVHEHSEVRVMRQRNLVPTLSVFAFRPLARHHFANDLRQPSTLGSDRICERL